MKSFTVRAVPSGSTCTVILTGELDIAAVPDISQLGERIFEDPSTGTVIVDLAAVTFMDSTAIGLLVTMRNAAIQTGKELTLSRVSEQVRRVLTITGLVTAFGLDTLGAQPLAS